jgi:hypothetical protein
LANRVSIAVTAHQIEIDKSKAKISFLPFLEEHPGKRPYQSSR